MSDRPTPPDAQVGLPSEEEVRRIVDDALNSAIPEPWEVSAHATQRILDLIRPAFEAVEHECQSSMMEIARERARADAAEASSREAMLMVVSELANRGVSEDLIGEAVGAAADRSDALVEVVRRHRARSALVPKI